MSDNPNFAAAYYNRGTIFFQQNLYDNAIQAFSKAIEINPNFSLAYLNRGVVLFEQKFYNDAIQDFSIAIKLNSALSLAYHNRGRVLYEQKLYDDAAQDFSKAIEIDPNYAAAYLHLGLVFYKQKLFDDAILDFSKAIELNPNLAEAYHNRGLVLSEQKLYDDSIEDCSKAIELNPNYFEAYNNRGHVLSEQKLYDDSIEDYSKAIELNPNYFEAYYNRGHVLSKKEQYDDAICDYSRAIELNPNYAFAYNNRGVLLFEKKLYYDAIQDYSRAIELNPNYAEVYYNRGNAFEVLGKLDECFQDLNSFLYVCIKNNKIFSLHRLIGFYAGNYPYSVITILESFTITYFDIILNPFENSINTVRDFTLLIDYYEKATVFDRNMVLSIKALFYYYLGGSVSSYIIYDEQLDSGNVQLTSLDLYYYALTSIDVNLDPLTVVNNCIEECPKDNDIDLYYLGHLYLFVNEKKKAIECFKDSKDFIFSNILLVYLIESEKEQREYFIALKNRHSKLQFKFEKRINIEAKDISQFIDYFHCRECATAIDYINTNFDISIKSDSSPFWEMFYLDSPDTDSLNININRAEIKVLIHEIENAFIESLEINMPENRELVVRKLENYFRELQSLEITKLFYFLGERINDKSDFENQLAKVIENWKPEEPRLYILFIQYYFLTNQISAEQTFSLFLYLLKIYTQEKNKTLENTITELFTVLGKLGKVIVPNLGIKISLGLMENAKPFIQNILMDYDDFDVDRLSDYNTFKNNLWKFINIEKQTLSEKEFNNKYRIFKWFDTYEFN